jgi:predicted nucleic acid-binding Zn ribbon protein
MPKYTFRCRKCQQVFEYEHGMTEEHPKLCEVLIEVAPGYYEPCAGELERVFHPLGVVYKAAGFYTVERRFDKNPIDEE